MREQSFNVVMVSLGSAGIMESNEAGSRTAGYNREGDEPWPPPRVRFLELSAGPRGRTRCPRATVCIAGNVSCISYPTALGRVRVVSKRSRPPLLDLREARFLRVQGSP